MKRFGFILLLISFGLVKAQQVEDFSLVRENAFILNPAIAGTEGYVHGFGTFRKQFLQIQESPYTAVLGATGQIAAKHIGLGGYLIHDVTGPTGKSGASFAFAYNLPLQKKRSAHYTNGDVDNTLSFGVSISVVQYRLEASQLLLDNPGDPKLFSQNGFKIFPDASFGIYYQWRDNFFAGISVPQIMGLNVNYRAADGTAEIKRVQQLNFLVGGKYAWARDKFSINPVAGLHWENGGPPQGEIGLRFNMYNIFWLGFDYKSVSYGVFEAGFNVKDVFTIAYAYDLSLAKYRPDVGASHEISLGFNIIKSTRVWRGVGPALRF
ncbi:MAG TPA: PorP/SprF family type IX secretion system membrane protein [Chitinophagales bacterium]|nr:PorP/SprF family type IX secretion system membrane protein [Chitinophagales bacterium]